MMESWCNLHAFNDINGAEERKLELLEGEIEAQVSQVNLL